MEKKHQSTKVHCTSCLFARHDETGRELPDHGIPCEDCRGGELYISRAESKAERKAKEEQEAWREHKTEKCFKHLSAALQGLDDIDSGLEELLYRFTYNYRRSDILERLGKLYLKTKETLGEIPESLQIVVEEDQMKVGLQGVTAKQ